MGRAIELESHGPVSLRAYAMSVGDSDTMQAAYAPTAPALRERPTRRAARLSLIAFTVAPIAAGRRTQQT